MTNEEALDKMTNLAVTYSQIDADTCELFTIAKEALEKQIPRKPDAKRHNICIVYRCPVCGKLLTTYYPGMHVFVCDRTKFCTDCGQEIDWSEDNEN